MNETTAITMFKDISKETTIISELLKPKQAKIKKRLEEINKDFTPIEEDNG